jgi:hypothetical protein
MLSVMPGSTVRHHRNAHKWHSEQLTRYPLMQGYKIPRPRIVREILTKLIEAVYVAIWDRDIYERDRASERNLGLSVDLDAAYGSE